MKLLNFATPFLTMMLFVSCNSTEEKNGKDTSINTSPSLKEENVTYSGDNITMNGFIVYDENLKGTRPAILVVHEWWGLNEYVKTRSRELAKLGYIAMAVDMYGNGVQADNPEEAGKLSTPFYSNPQMARVRFDAAVMKLKTYSQVDTARIGAMGYCFGGAQVLTFAKLGADLDGVVSFHGNLNGVSPQKELLKAAILVCHGAADPFVPEQEVTAFKKQMDSVGASYTFKAYDSAVHAFTNPGATAMGEKFNIPIRYDAKADSASWNDMKSFWEKVFRN